MFSFMCFFNFKFYKKLWSIFEFETFLTIIFGCTLRLASYSITSFFYFSCSVFLPRVQSFSLSLIIFCFPNLIITVEKQAFMKAYSITHLRRFVLSPDKLACKYIRTNLHASINGSLFSKVFGA